MISFINFFILWQTALLLVMTFHDWVHLPPLTNICELEKHSSFWGRVVNSLLFFIIVFVPLALTYLYQPVMPFYIAIQICLFYGLLTLGTIFAWWVPYFFGSSEQHKKDFIEYENTHHFLPPIGDNVIPNTFHVLLHLQIWSCFGMALYLLWG